MAVWTLETYTHENVNGGALVNTIAPENLHFVLNLPQVGGVSTVDFEVSFGAVDAVSGEPLVSHDFISPKQHDFLLKRSDLDDPIMGGIITEVSGQDDGDPPIDSVGVSGSDWLFYLTGRQWPYDADPHDDAPNGWSLVPWMGPAGAGGAGGLFYNIFASEIADIVRGILETIRDMSANWPADPDEMANYRGVWLSGAAYVVDDCVSDDGQIWKAVADNTGDEPPSGSWVAIFPSFSLPFTTDGGDFDHTGKTIDYQIATFDTSSIFDLIQTLSQAGLENGGFDFEITWDKRFKLHAPEIGDPDVPIFEIVVDGTPAFANALSVGFTNDGPRWTHFLGTAAGSAGGGTNNATGNQGGINKHFRASSAAFRRWDGSSSFGTVRGKNNASLADLDLLESLTSLQLAFGSNPAHTIPIEVKPRDIDGFWLAARPGQYVNVIYDLGFHKINSVQKIISMDCTVDTEGEETVTLGFNQFYDASDTSGLDDI